MSITRTNPGRVEWHREAAAAVREERRELIQVWLTILGLVLFLNLPYFPRWLAGLATGALLTFLICMTCCPSGTPAVWATGWPAPGRRASPTRNWVSSGRSLAPGPSVSRTEGLGDGARSLR